MDIEDIINEHVKTDWKPILIKLLEPHKDNINYLLNEEYTSFGEKRFFQKKI